MKVCDKQLLFDYFSYSTTLCVLYVHYQPTLPACKLVPNLPRMITHHNRHLNEDNDGTKEDGMLVNTVSEPLRQAVERFEFAIDSFMASTGTACSPHKECVQTRFHHGSQGLPLLSLQVRASVAVYGERS